MRNAMSSHRLGASIEEEGVHGALRADGKPFLERYSCFSPQGKGPFLPSLAHYVYGLAILSEVGAIQPDKLRHPDSGGICKMQHCTIPYTAYCRGVRRFKQGLDLIAVEVIHNPPIETLRGDRVYLPA